MINQESAVFVEDMSSTGKGISRINGKMLFIDHALPGQTVKIKIKKHHKDFIEAKAVSVETSSPIELELPYQNIPGAPWIRLPAEKQKEYKIRLIADHFKKNAGLDIQTVFQTYITSPRLFDYRNKMTYSFGYTEEAFLHEEKKFSKSGFGLGSRKRGNFILVESLLNPSGIFDELFEAGIPKIRDFCLKTGLPPYDPKQNRGFFRYLNVRKSFFQNRLVIVMYTHSDYSSQFDDAGFYDLLRSMLGERLAGYIRRNHDGVSDAGMELAAVCFEKGENAVTEKINGLTFTISEESFFQTNPATAEKLYETVVASVSSTDGCILDLFCGTGTMTRIIQHTLPNTDVIGVELSSAAVNDAMQNTANDPIQPMFVCADVKHFLRDFKASQKPLTVVMNPPRAGVSPKPLQAVIKLAPDDIIYVSCNPATLSRDCAVLTQGGYRPVALTAVDQFPHTPHVECVMKFVRSSKEIFTGQK